MAVALRLEINTDSCAGCNICAFFCPKDVLELDSSGKAVAARSEDCIYCGECEIRCPDSAITILKEQTA